MAKTDNCPAIGIDLGTTYSCVAVWQHDRVQIIENDQGNRITPSCVAFTEYERLIGDAAKNQIAANPFNTIFDAKRLIGRRFDDDIVQKDMKSWPFQVERGVDNKPLIAVSYKGEQKEFTPQEISSMVLTKMKDTAKAYLGANVKDAVITVPAYFDDSQRQATKDAGLIAGLNVINIINEPTAAAIAYGFDKNMVSDPNSKRNVLIFDLGGGTFDVSLVCIKKGEIEVKAVSGDTHLGGDDFDSNIVSSLIEDYKRKYGVDVSSKPRVVARLRKACERAKRVLSTSVDTTIEIECLFDGNDFSSKLSRAKFERINAHLFEQCMGPVDDCLKEAKMEKSDVDEVVLVGGSTRIPKIQQMLQDHFNGKELSKGINADEAVAYGAALHAAVLSDVQLSKDFVLSDVTPLSLGMELCVGDVMGLMEVIVPRNTTIPATRTLKVTTHNDNQTSIAVSIYQGERAMVADNNLLGSFDITGIRPLPRHYPRVLVSFDINKDGILTVSARDEITGNENQITVANNGKLSKAEIDRMVKDGEIYKAADEQLKKARENKNALENYANEMRVVVKKNDKRIGGKCKEKVEKAIEETLNWLELIDHTLELTDPDAFQDKLEFLQGICDFIGSICC